MKKHLARIMEQIKCIRVQVFLSYFLVLSISFLVLGFSVTLAARQLLIDQIGASRLDMLRQISERANTVKTSATTLSGLYRYELMALPEGEWTAEEINEEMMQQKEKYSGVFDPIGMDHDPVIVTAGETFSSLPEGELPQYLEDQLWYRRLRRNLLNAEAGAVMFSSTFPAAEGGEYRFAAAQLMVQDDREYMLLVLMNEQAAPWSPPQLWTTRENPFSFPTWTPGWKKKPTSVCWHPIKPAPWWASMAAIMTASPFTAPPPLTMMSRPCSCPWVGG